MARIYANENFDFGIVELLRSFKHDVLTTKDAGNANKNIPDEAVLAFANVEKRVVVTFNYQDFKKLHRQFPDHSGIIICTEDKDLEALALRIHRAIEAENGFFEHKLIRVIRPNFNLKP
jgi:predicted nuclease of predicted toxin-antitoxin system